MDKSQSLRKFTVRYGYAKKSPKPSIFSSLRDKEGLDLLGTASFFWRGGPELPSLNTARRSGADWNSWGEVVYYVGTPGLVHLSQSPHHFEDLSDFVTVSESQFDAIISDFKQFATDGIEFERQY